MMKVLVIGCGRLGGEVAYRLFQRGHEVSVVDDVAAAFHSLPSDFEGRTNEGDALNQDVLRRAGIETADALAAVTNSDALNIVAAIVAKQVYHIPSVVARNYDPHLRSLFEAADIQVVSSTSWGAQRIEEMLYHGEIKTVFSAGNGEVEVYEFILPENMDGRKLSELLPDEGCVAVALTRAGKSMLPGRDTILKTSDVLHLSATFEGVEAVRTRCGMPKQEE
jgi:trk system potassium uptake protein TrkA